MAHGNGTPQRRAEDHSPAALVGDRRKHLDPHPDEVSEAAGVLLFYGGHLGPLGEDAVRRVLVAAKAWRDRRDADERRHARLRDEIAVRVTAWRAVPIQNPCVDCGGEGGCYGSAGMWLTCPSCHGEAVIQ